MSGKDRFGAFARANNLVGVENSDSPPRVPRFNKPARLPSSEESHRAAKERELREAGMGEVSPVQRETRRSSRKREFPDSWVGESIPVQDHSKSEKREKEREGRRRVEDARRSSRRDPSPARNRRPANPSDRGESEKKSRRRKGEVDSEPDTVEELTRLKRESLPAQPEQKHARSLRSESSLSQAKSQRKEEKTLAPEPFGGFHPDKLRPDPSPRSFEKEASKPNDDGESYSYETEEEPPILPAFTKAAQVPSFPVPPLEEKTLPRITPKAGATAENAEAKEKAALETFDVKSLEIYLELQERGVEMEIDSILKEVKSDEDWVVAFSSLVRPKRAATGMRYARLLENLITWTKAKEGETGTKSRGLLDRESVWAYLHDLSLKGVGRYTPKGVVNAIRFFGEAFGLESSAVLCRRVKKLTESHCKETKPRNQAPMLTLKTLELLEAAVTDPSIQKGVRIAAGKLRLCVQASLRWDDLARTPMANVEWVRRRGSERVIGLRSRFGDSKTGPRPWVSSYLGVTPEGDDWLPVLMNLVLSSHGEAWRSHDHFGKSFSPTAVEAKVSMASFDQDVYFVRQLLLDHAVEGSELDLTADQAQAFRWHGAKATLTTIMMHLNIGDRAVRFSGNWKDAREAMPDTYLRESQLLVLEAQEKALEYLRCGGEIISLEAVPLVRTTGESWQGSTSEGKREGGAPKPETPQGLSFDDVPKEVLEPAASHGKVDPDLLASEAGETVDIESVDRFLEMVQVENIESGGEDESVVEIPETPESDSDDEFYLGSFLKVSPSLRIGSLHKAKADTIDLPRCGQAGKRFERVAACDSIERRTTFCQKCFGKVVGCDKLCSALKELDGPDGVAIAGRCMRRCCLGCEDLAKFMGKDERDHLCSYHKAKKENEDGREIEELPVVKDELTSPADGS